MPSDSALNDARDIMLAFSQRTGVSNAGAAPRRYLWTDAHAVCNFLTLYREFGQEEFLQLALSLVDQVHRVLGRHRDDDPRDGWISGLDETEGRKHPTAGGLRIGKELNERGPDAPYDERLEWDRDGQYFHYLTKWMHALCRTAQVTGDSRYCRWAGELAVAAQAGFAHAGTAGGARRLVWKMSIDLSRPLVPSTGLHDPLDGYVTYNEVAHCAGRFEDERTIPGLDAEIAEVGSMLGGGHWHTDDPLGIGGLLFDACRLVQILPDTDLQQSGVPQALLRSCVHSLSLFARVTPFRQPAAYRLAFRELGMAIGLRGAPIIQGCVDRQADRYSRGLPGDVDKIGGYRPLADEIEQFWRRAESRRAGTWTDHLDINEVMLATSLAPAEFLAA